MFFLDIKKLNVLEQIADKMINDLIDSLHKKYPQKYFKVRVTESKKKIYTSYFEEKNKKIFLMPRKITF